jgi:hypothetical protein
MANLTPPPPRSAASQTPPAIFCESNPVRAFQVKPKAAPAFPAGQRCVLCGGSDACPFSGLKRRPTFAILQSRARYPSGKGEVCKTFIRGFDSHPRLQQIPSNEAVHFWPRCTSLSLSLPSGQLLSENSISTPHMSSRSRVLNPVIFTFVFSFVPFSTKMPPPNPPGIAVDSCTFCRFLYPT